MHGEAGSGGTTRAAGDGACQTPDTLVAIRLIQPDAVPL